MSFYKLISGETFVGIVTQHDFLRYQQKHRILLSCDEEEAQYVQYEGKLYRDNWMVAVNTDTLIYDTVSVIAIDESEYGILLDAISTGKEIEVPAEEEIAPDVPETEEQPDVTIEYVRNMKIAEMSYICNKAIENGFDVTLSDGKEYHFSLTTQDQLNLITLSTMVASGENAIPYHADGELCKFYSAEDVTAMLAAATAYKVYHVSYFNALKMYIEALPTIEDVGLIQYGVEIPEEYQSDVLRTLLADSTGCEL